MRILVLLSTFVVTVLLGGSAAYAACGDCQVLDFGKKIQLNLIGPMLTMSTEKKIDYIRGFGLDLYKIKDSSNDENYPVVRLGFLPLPSVEQHPTWNKFIKIFDEGVLGLFLTPSNAANRVEKPTIFYNERADDWTIVHEFMHFLFDRARHLEDGTAESRVVNNLQDAKEDFFENWNRYRDTKGYQNDNHKRNLVQSFVTFIETQRFLLINFELEEVIIEKVLREIYVAERPLNFDDKHFQRSTRYIRSTSNAAFDQIRPMLETCDDIKRTLTSKDKDLLAEVYRVCGEVEGIKSQGSSILKLLNIPAT